MHIKELKKAVPLLQQLEGLDKEIIQLQKYGILIQDKALEIQLELSHKKLETEKVEFDSDGSLTFGRSLHEGLFSGLLSIGRTIKQAEDKDTCKIEVSEVIALQVLGVIVAHKEAERMYIINQLNKMGFHISQ